MRSPIVTELSSWPQPGVPSEAVVFATETKLFVRYLTPENGMAIIQFPLVRSFSLGAPNDEALGGHSLYKFGLKHYTVHRVGNSPWIDALEKKNAIHPHHDKEQFLKGLVHYIFTFQDSTFECVAHDGEFWEPKMQIFPSSDEARVAWVEMINEPT